MRSHVIQETKLPAIPLNLFIHHPQRKVLLRCLRMLIAPIYTVHNRKTSMKYFIAVVHSKKTQRSHPGLRVIA